MSSTTALVPYPFEGHRIRVSTDEHGEAWFAAADVAVALGQHSIARGLTSLREEELCLHSQEGPGSEGCTLALISEDGLFRLLLRNESPAARRMRRWLTHGLLPAIQRRHPHAAPQEGNPIETIRRQSAAAVLREADGISELTVVSPKAAMQEACSLPRRAGPEQGEQLERSPPPHPQPVPAERPAVAWLTADQVADRLDRTLRGTNQRLAACGLQVRNDEDDWQLTEAGRDWGIALPICSNWERRQQIHWDPAVVTLLEGDHR